jgi:hypothetical protein
MSGGPVAPIPPHAVRGASDWDDEDLLTIAEASERLAEEINAARRRVRQAEEVLGDENSPAVGAVHVAGLAAERRRLHELIRAAQRIQAVAADAPR